MPAIAAALDHPFAICHAVVRMTHQRWSVEHKGQTKGKRRTFRDTVNSVTVQLSVLNSLFRKPARISGCARHAWWSNADSCCDAVAVCLPVLLCGRRRPDREAMHERRGQA